MAKIISKKRIAAGLFALSAGLVLAACDPITATPKSYMDTIVTMKDGSEVDLDAFLKGETINENIIGKIYDQIATDKNSKVVDKLLKIVADKMYGSYNEIVAAAESETEAEKYINNHKEVFLPENDMVLAKKRLSNFLDDLSDRLSEQFYNEIKSGTYNDEQGRFDESKLMKAHYYEFYDIGFEGGAEPAVFFVTNELKKEDAFDELNGTYTSIVENGRGYIEEKIFPQIIKDKLVEEYIVKNNANALGRAYARKVEYFKVTYADNDRVPTAIMQQFASTFIEGSDAATKNDALDYAPLEAAFNGYSEVDEETGVVTPIATFDGSTLTKTDENAYNLLQTSLNFTDPTELPLDEEVFIKLEKDVKLDEDVLLPSTGLYFKNTELGKLVEKINKARTAVEDGRFADSEDKADLDALRVNNKSIEFNVRKEIISLAGKDYTTDGWFVKNGGLSELPSELRDRLFNINVAHKLDNGSIRYEDGTIAKTVENQKTADANGHYAIGAYEYGNEDNRNRTPYMRNINGRMFVIPSDVLSYEKDKFNYVYQDVSNKAFYIVQVYEAPSTPKLNAESDESYNKIYDDTFKVEEVQREIAKVLGTKDNYIKDAYTEYLDQFCYEYYDTSFRDYFEGEYPDLFPED